MVEEEVWLVPLLTCHCGPSRPILVLINEAVGSDSLGKRRAVFPFTEAAHVYLPTTDGPPGAPRGPQGSFALGILRLNQRTGSRAPSPDLQVTLAFYLLPKAVTYCVGCWPSAEFLDVSAANKTMVLSSEGPRGGKKFGN